VGKALEHGRTEATWSAGSNHRKGRAYNEEFNKWRKANGFDVIDTGTLSRLSRCLEHQAEIEVWRATLSPDELMQINHPNVVWRKWNASVAKAKPEHAPRTSLKDEIVRLEHELSRAEANGGERFTAKDSARDIVTTLVLMLPPPKLNQVIDLLVERRTAKKHKGAGVQTKAEPRAE